MLLDDGRGRTVLAAHLLRSRLDGCRPVWAPSIEGGRSAIDALSVIAIGLHCAPLGRSALGVVVVWATVTAMLDATRVLGMGQERLTHVCALLRKRGCRTVDALGVVLGLDDAGEARWAIGRACARGVWRAVGAIVTDRASKRRLCSHGGSGSSGGSSGESVSTNGARRTIEPTTDMLRMAAAEVYGLWPNGTARKADEHDLRTMAERLKEANTTAVDLPTAFALFREQRTRSRFKPSGKTIEAVLTAFDSDNTGALALDKFGRIAAAFDASKADVDRVLKEAMMSLEQPGAVHTTYVHIGNAALALQQRSAEIEIKTTK